MSERVQSVRPRRPAVASLSEATVAVVGGGTSEERDVSLRTRDEVVAALRRPGGPRRLREIEILADGRWSWEGGAMSPARVVEELAAVDLFFLALHGGAGEDGTVQGLLEACGHRYTGSGVAASALCMDKEVQRVFLRDRGLRVAPGLAFDRRAWTVERRRIEEALAHLDGPGWVVKPRRSGSSFGISVIAEARELPDALRVAFAIDDDVLVEARVEGVEATCGVLGNGADEELDVLPPVEIRPQRATFFDFRQKYDAEEGADEICPPDTLDERVCARLQELTERAHRELGCDGYSRSDFLVPPDGEPVFLETNTLPGLTARSLLPLEAAAVGLGFDALCRRIAELGLAARPARPRGAGQLAG